MCVQGKKDFSLLELRVRCAPPSRPKRYQEANSIRQNLLPQQTAALAVCKEYEQYSIFNLHAPVGKASLCQAQAREAPQPKQAGGWYLTSA